METFSLIISLLVNAIICRNDENYRPSFKGFVCDWLPQIEIGVPLSFRVRKGLHEYFFFICNQTKFNQFGWCHGVLTFTHFSFLASNFHKPFLSSENSPVFCARTILGIFKSVRVLKGIPQWREDKNPKRLPELPETSLNWVKIVAN